VSVMTKQAQTDIQNEDVEMKWLIS
jgi:hypothetical protein